MRKIVTVLFCIFCAACHTNSDKTLNSKDVVLLEEEDSEMNKAIKKSRDTFGEFLTVLKSADSTNQGFAIKYPFKQDSQDNNEHIWLTPITIEENTIYGIVNNEPVRTSKVKLGQKVKIDSAIISDWSYIHDGKLIGGYSLRLLRDRMSPQEKADFDKSTGIVFGD